MVTLNQAIATAMVHGPSAGLALLEPLDADGRMKGHDRSSRMASVPERNYLMTQAAWLSECLDPHRAG